jgi:hypothetical protein
MSHYQGHGQSTGRGGDIKVMGPFAIDPLPSIDAVTPPTSGEVLEGTPATPESTQTRVGGVCYYCNTPASPGERFCLNCGKKLRT